MLWLNAKEKLVRMERKKKVEFGRNREKRNRRLYCVADLGTVWVF